jgi:hypothetical protein
MCNNEAMNETTETTRFSPEVTLSPKQNAAWLHCLGDYATEAEAEAVLADTLNGRNPFGYVNGRVTSRQTR